MLTRIGGVGQKAGTADARGEVIWRRVLHLVSLLRCALSASHLARSVLRVGESPNRQRFLIVKAKLLR